MRRARVSVVGKASCSARIERMCMRMRCARASPTRAVYMSLLASRAVPWPWRMSSSQAPL
jgi:hypothetical protein